MTVTTQTAPKPLSAGTTLADEELLRRYRRHGDRRAFEQLVRRYEGELYSYLRRYLSDAAMAEDAFQATFLQIHLKCDQFDESRPFRPWLYTIATNQAIDASRRNKRHRMVSLDRRNRRGHNDDVGSLLEMSEADVPGPHCAMESEERRALVRQAIDDLPETLRSAVTLIYYQGLKYREAAEVLDIPVGTVKSRLHAAVHKLNEIFERTQLLESVQPDA